MPTIRTSDVVFIFLREDTRIRKFKLFVNFEIIHLSFREKKKKSFWFVSLHQRIYFLAFVILFLRTATSPARIVCR